MTSSLVPLIQSPVVSSSFPTFPNEDRFGMVRMLFRTIAVWETDATGGFKLSFTLFIKKVFSFLDRCGIGSYFYKRGFTSRVQEYKFWLSTHRQLCAGMQENARYARQLIVSALGGAGQCETYPVVQLKPEDRAEYLILKDRYFSPGQYVIQGVDEKDRKFVVLRLNDSYGALIIATVHQLYHETHSEGNTWVANFHPSSSYGIRSGLKGVFEVMPFIRDKISFPHREEKEAPYCAVPKPS